MTGIYSMSFTISDGGKISHPNANPMACILAISGSSQPRRQLRLTYTEFLACKEKGSCFHCDEKFRPGHKCKRQLNILLVYNDDDSALLEGVKADWAQVGSQLVKDGTLFTACVLQLCKWIYS